MNLVFAHPSGGRVYQSDMKLLLSHEWQAYEKENRKVTILACAAELMEEGFETGKIKCYGIPLWDFEKTEKEQKELLSALRGVVNEAAKEVLAGNDLISICMMGLNRSALLNSLCLKKLGLHPDRIIEMIRTARGPRAMRNNSFVKMLFDA